MNRGRRFSPGWRMTIFTVLLLPLVVALGFWQLDRAEEKRGYEMEYLERLAALPVPVSEGSLPFQRVRLTGQYDPDFFLVDNQVRASAPGYEVISVFRGDDGHRWLVNRGFVPGDPARRTLPKVPTPAGRLTVVGVIWPDLGLMPMFGGGEGRDNWSEGWPKVVQRMEVERMAASVDAAAVEIRLEPDQPGVLTPPLMQMNMPAAKHTAYAVQWFGLAAALVVGYVVFGLRRRHGR